MSTHSHLTWEFGQSITEELIDEIIRIIKENSYTLAFAITNRVDQFAFCFINKISLKNMEEQNKGLPHWSQFEEIYIRVQNKLNRGKLK